MSRRVSSWPSDLSTREYDARGPGGDQLLAGSYDEDARAARRRCDVDIRLGRVVARRVELHAEETESLGHVGANGRRVFADTSGEDERVEAAGGNRHRSDRRR